MKDYRRSIWITQRQLSKLIGIHVNTLSKWESGTISPPIDQLLKIMRVLVRYSSKDLSLVLTKKYGSHNQDSDDSDPV